jgi:hypothetical protein
MIPDHRYHSKTGTTTATILEREDGNGSTENKVGNILENKTGRVLRFLRPVLSATHSLSSSLFAGVELQ